MTQEDLEVLAGFGAVWERVSGQHIETEAVSKLSWEELLCALHDYWVGCRELANCAAGTHRRRLLALAGEAKTLFQSMQTEYFLDTGDIFVSVNEKSFASYTAYNLRKLYKNAVNLAELLQKAEEAGCLPVGDAGSTAARHKAQLKKLLGECLQ
ncbi:MAG: hypothetical protein IJA67_09170 [Oscillospiraceae bacterium]|nr:hypothetical protein [Oscillospiraceae bacterium]